MGLNSSYTLRRNFKVIPKTSHLLLKVNVRVVTRKSCHKSWGFFSLHFLVCGPCLAGYFKRFHCFVLSFCGWLKGGDSDMRFVYSACCVSFILDDWSAMDTRKAVDFVKSSLVSHRSAHFLSILGRLPFVMFTLMLYMCRDTMEGWLRPPDSNPKAGRHFVVLHPWPLSAGATFRSFRSCERYGQSSTSFHCSCWYIMHCSLFSTVRSRKTIFKILSLSFSKWRFARSFRRVFDTVLVSAFFKSFSIWFRSFVLYRPWYTNNTMISFFRLLSYRRTNWMLTDVPT